MTGQAHNETRIAISEGEAEKIADQRVQRALNTDRAYLNAEDAEAQSAREDAIAADTWRVINAEYDVI